MIPVYLKKQTTRIILPSLLVAVLFIAAIFHIILPAFQDSLMQSKKKYLQETTHIAYDLLAFIKKLEETGLLSREKAQRMAIEQIRSLHYGPDEKDYFWINDLEPSMVMHPYRPDLEGQNISSFTDPDGKKIFVNFVETVNRQESGFVDYMWQWKDDPDRIVPKLSYVKIFEPWGWIIGTGVYLEDARIEFRKVTNNLIRISVSILMMLALFWVYLLGQGLRSARAREKAEREVENYRENLQQLVEKRTIELATTNEKLRKEVHERKHSEKNLRESESRYRGLFELANDAIYIIQSDKCVRCNYKTLEMFGCTSRNQFAGHSPLEFSPEKQPDGEFSQTKFQKKWDLVVQGKPQSFEWSYTALNNRSFDADVSLTLIEIDGKESVQAIVRDITLRKQREIELQRNQKLESLGILAGGIAHDFNNLLTVIIGNISLIINTQNMADIQEMLIKCEKASLKAKELTQQLLTFSKGGSPIKKITSIGELIKDSTMFSLLGSNITYSYNFAPDLWPVEVDEGQLSQVIQNLVINACQAMPDGGAIKLSAKNIVVEDHESLPLIPGKYIKISVQDQGGGISQENLQNIFDPYFTTKQQGSGLGLAVAYSVIQKHDGYINVESDKGEGTKFLIYLPASPENGSIPQQVFKQHFTKGSGMILIMDDESDIRNFISSALELMGFECVSVTDGSKAIDLYTASLNDGIRFDAVIMDLTIPGGMGGKETIQHMLEIDPGAKVIVASGYANDPIMANFSQYGFSGVIAKPFDISELSIVLHKTLGRSLLNNEFGQQSIKGG